jgi:hypothetical protein
MKIWKSYGSEHSANLVMIGHFKDEVSAEKAKEAIDEISDCLTADTDHHEPERYSDAVYTLLKKLEVHSLSPTELEQFKFGVRPDVKGDRVVIRTDEPELSAFLKLMVDHGARVEVYCASDYPNS